MKKVVTICIAIIVGMGLGIALLTVINGYMCYTVNIIDLLMLIATIVLAVAVVYLTRALQKKETAREIISKDLLELCDTLMQNKLLLDNLSKERHTKEEVLEEIRMTFHRSDMMNDLIISEFNESFPGFLKTNHDIENIITPYWKWLTDGDMQRVDFRIDSKFLKEHETILISTISKLRLIIHRLIKNS